MQKLAEICIKRPVFASVLVLLFTVVGLFGYLKLGVDRFPDVEFPFVAVSTTLPGAAPEEMETEVTDRIEEAINTVSGIDELRSISGEGYSQVLIQFVLEKDANVAASEVRDRVSRARATLPEDIDEPIVERFDLNAMPIVTIAISADRPISEVTEYVDKVLRRRLESTNGVGQVIIAGGQPRQVNVVTDPARLQAENLTIVDVERALRLENAQTPGGTIKRGGEEFTLRTLGKVNNVEQIEKLAVARRGERTVTIGDVAKVEDATREPDSYSELNGRNAVLLSVRKQSKTNTVQVADAVRERLEEEKALAPAGYEIEITRDESVFIRAATHSVQEHLLLGSAFAAIVVLLFLANWRTTLIAAIAIPTSIISTFGLMWFQGYTLNMVTLLALTLSVGIVVDDAIVVLENIFRYIDEKGYSPFDAAREATREIGLAVMSITLSLIAVFLPIAFMGGIVGQYMGSFGVTMSFAIAISLIVSFTMTPMLSARMLRGKKRSAAEIEEAESTHFHTTRYKWYSPYGWVERIYMVLLGFSLRHRWVIVLLCFGALGSIPILVKNVNKNFLPADDQSDLFVDVRAPEGTSLEATRLILQRIATDLRGLDGVEYTVMTAGESNASNYGSVYVRLVKVQGREYTQFEMMDHIRKQLLPKYKNENLRTSVESADHRGGPGGRNADVMFVVSGPNLDKLADYSKKIADGLKEVKGALDVDSSLVLGKPQYGVTVDRAKAAELGVSVTDVARALRLLVAGDRVSSYDEGGERYDVVLQAPKDIRNNVEMLKGITVTSSRLGSVPITDVVKFESSTGPAEIQRLNRRRQVTIYSGVAPGESQQAVIDAANKIAKDLDMEPGYTSGLAGRSKELAKSATAFFLVFVMSLAFMYLVIAAQFESWLHPLTILLSLPLTLPFALFAVWISNESLNIFSMLGVLVLFAVVKKNSILQIDHANQLRAKGMEKMEAILQSNRDRLRPILMTTAAFVAGMIPLAASTGVGAATNRTIAYVVIGGQTLSLLLTLLAIPVAYSLFDDVIHSRLWGWIGRGFRRRRPAEAA